MMYKFEVYSDDMVFTASFDPDSDYVFCSVDDIGIGLDSAEIEAFSNFIENANKVIKSNTVKKE